MHCPFCGADDTKVVDSRLTPDGARVRRRRRCPDCGERFTTFEVAELRLPRVVKSDGLRVDFDPEKLRTGMARALEKRPVSTEDLNTAIRRIEHRLATSGRDEIPSRLIGDLAMGALRDLDHVAYVRFASVYLAFEDIEAFRELVDSLAQELTPEARRAQRDLLDSGEGA